MTSLIALHGFLGLPGDWTNLTDWKALGWQMNAVDIWRDLPLSSLEDAASSLNEQTKGNGHFLVGYSLGGRIALHALIQNPKRWAGAVFVSSHLGLASLHEKTLRAQHDEQWAKRFENESWDQVIADWNKQLVFGDSLIERYEKDYDKKKLAAALRNCSLAKQMSMERAVACVECPILWVAGEKDSKYAAQAKRVRLSHPRSKVIIVENADHRVPWHQKKTFLSLLQTFINGETYTQTTSRIGDLARSSLAFEPSEAVDEAAQLK